MKMMKEDVCRSIIGKTNDQHNMKADSSAHVVGNKVLPVSDSASSSSSSLSSSSNNTDDHQQQQSRPLSDQKKDRPIIKGEINSKSKTLSRMKELLRWAAAAKSDRATFGSKLMQLKNRSATMMETRGLDGELSSDETPKLSLQWEVVESCDDDTNCSVASAPSLINYDESYHRTGSWITTDDEFVVLEL